MGLIKIVAISLLSTCFVGCTTMSAPSSTILDEKSVITIGSMTTPPDDHIVFIPANTEFPIEFSVKGDVFTQSKSSKVMVSFKQNMYLYQYWASLDGITWMNSHKIINVEPSGGFDTAGGKVEVKLDLAN